MTLQEIAAAGKAFMAVLAALPKEGTRIPRRPEFPWKDPLDCYDLGPLSDEKPEGKA